MPSRRRITGHSSRWRSRSGVSVPRLWAVSMRSLVTAVPLRAIRSRSASSGTGTTARMRSMMSSAVTPSASASYDSTNRWRRTSWAISRRSCGSAYSRPRTSASALPARIRLIEARGLAPKVMKRDSSPSPTAETLRVALASLTAYSISAGSTKTASAARCSPVSCPASIARPSLLERRGHALDDHELLGRASDSRSAPSA